MGQDMLQIKDLHAGYGDRAVAALPWLSVPGGEAALLLGPSGSGKTTLLLAIAGLAKAFSGDIEVDDVNVARLPAAALDRFRGRHIGLVFQDFHLLAGLSVLDNVLLAPFAIGARQDAKAAMALLEALGLAEKAHQPAQRLSRGQAQRVAIARAMLLGPKLILADEPTASLDDAAAARVAELLLSVAKDTGAALLIATHDQRLRALVDRQVLAQAPTFEAAS